MKEFIEEDLEFAKRTEEAWQEIDEGKCTCVNSEDFLKEIKKFMKTNVINSEIKSVYGDGNASDRISKTIKNII